MPAGAAGPIERRGSSLAPLQVDTLADVLVAARPGAEVYSFSLKDRGALLGAGRRPRRRCGWTPRAARMVTSTAFAQAVPAWAALFADGAAVKRAFAPVWQPLDAGWLASHAATRDDQEGEGDYLGLGTVFPHSATSVKAMRATPGGDRLLLDLARAAATHAAETAAGRPVLLALSLSSNDYVDHVFGPDSWEAWDELRRLDRGLAELLAALDALVGPERLRGHAHRRSRQRSAARDRAHRTGALVPARRAAATTGSGRAAAARASSRPTSRAGWTRRATIVAGVVDPFVYLTPQGKALPPAERAALHQRIDALFVGRGEIAQVIDIRTAPETCPPPSDESLPALTCRSLRRDQAGDFYLVPAPGAFFDPDLAVGRGSSHGSPYLYDRAVPLVVRAPGRVPAGAVRAEPTSYAAFTRTAAALLAIPEPPALAGSDAPDLTSAR